MSWHSSVSAFLYSQSIPKVIWKRDQHQGKCFKRWLMLWLYCRKQHESTILRKDKSYMIRSYLTTLSHLTIWKVCCTVCLCSIHVFICPCIRLCLFRCYSSFLKNGFIINVSNASITETRNRIIILIKIYKRKTELDETAIVLM